MTDGPPPVPGGRSPEEREAARRERAARRTGAFGAGRAAAPARRAAEPRDWLAEAERLTTTASRRRRPRTAPGRRARRHPRWGRLLALGAC